MEVKDLKRACTTGWRPCAIKPKVLYRAFIMLDGEQYMFKSKKGRTEFTRKCDLTLALKYSTVYDLCRKEANEVTGAWYSKEAKLKTEELFQDLVTRGIIVYGEVKL